MKKIFFDKKARKEFNKLPLSVKSAFYNLIAELEEFGSLDEPEAKKIRGTQLFEIRVRINGQWRGLYAYISNNQIIILKFFNKKQQKINKKYIKTAHTRLNNYI